MKNSDKGGIILKGGAASADKSIIVSAGNPVPNVREEGSVLNEAQQKEKEEKKKEILENIDKCQGIYLNYLKNMKIVLKG